MPTVLLAHSDPLQRESLATLLGAKGFSVVPIADVDAALDQAEGAIALLVEPSLLLAEEMDVQTRVDLRAGRAVRIIALTHKASAQDMAAFRKHGAGLLARPIEDVERLATMLRIQATEDAPWEPGAKPAPQAPDERWAKMPRLPAANAQPWDAPPPPEKEEPKKKKKRWWGKSDEEEAPREPAKTAVSAPAPEPVAEPAPAPAPPVAPTKNPWQQEEEELYGTPDPALTADAPVQPPKGELERILEDVPEELTSEQVIGTRKRTVVSTNPDEEHTGSMPAFLQKPAEAPAREMPKAVISDPSVLDAPAFDDGKTVVTPEDEEQTIASALEDLSSETNTRAAQIALHDAIPAENMLAEPTVPDPEGTVASADMPDQVPEPPEELDDWSSEIARAVNAQGPSVLVVDDEAAFRGFLRDALAQRGYRVHTAINANNALRFLRTNGDVDLVISDLNMPHMDGFELKHEIDVMTGRQMPFIIVTADTSDEKIQTAAQVGAAALVPKPIEDLDAFHAIVLDTLRDAGVLSR